MLTTDESLTLQGLLNKMSTQDILFFISERLMIKADNAANDGDFENEKRYVFQASKINDLIFLLGV